MAGQVLSLFPNHFAQPFADERAVDIVIIDPVLVAGVVRRVDVDALHLSGVIGQQGFEGNEVVALDNEVARAGVATGEFRHVFQ